MCQIPVKKWFKKSRILEQLTHFKISISATLMIVWHTWEDGSRKVNITTSISAQLPETVVLLWGKPFENPVFRPQSQGGKIQDFWISQFPDFHLSKVMGEPPSRMALTDILSGLQKKHWQAWLGKNPSPPLGSCGAAAGTRCRNC